MKQGFILLTTLFFSTTGFSAVIITDVGSSYINTYSWAAGHTVSLEAIYAEGHASPEEEDKVEIYPKRTSSFYTEFTLTQDYEFTIDLQLNAVSDWGDYESQAIVTLTNADTGAYYLGAISQGGLSSVEGDLWVTDYATGNLTIDQRVIALSAGNYILSAGAYASDGLFLSLNGEAEYSNYELTATFAAVPAPAAAWLFVSALTGLVCIKRKMNIV